MEHGGGTLLAHQVEVAVPLEGQLHAVLLPYLVAYVAVAARLVELRAAVDGVHLCLAEVQLLQCSLAVASLVEGFGQHEHHLDVAA